MKIKTQRGPSQSNLVTKKPDTDPITPVTTFIYIFLSSKGL